MRNKLTAIVFVTLLTLASCANNEITPILSETINEVAPSPIVENHLEEQSVFNGEAFYSLDENYLLTVGKQVDNTGIYVSQLDFKLYKSEGDEYLRHTMNIPMHDLYLTQYFKDDFDNDLIFYTPFWSIGFQYEINATNTGFTICIDIIYDDGYFESYNLTLSNDIWSLTIAPNTVITPSDSAIIRDLIGSWHAAPGIPAGYAERWMFRNDMTFVNYANSMDGAERLRQFSGKWSVENGVLNVFVDEELVITGGELVEDEIMGYMHEGGVYETRFHDAPELLSFSIEDKTFNHENTYAPISIKIGDTKYWGFVGLND